MIEYEGVNLRVAPQALPTVRAAFDRAIALLQPEIMRLGEVGHLLRPWMGDPVSEKVRVFYNEQVMEAEDGPYQALVLYLKELMRVSDQLYAMEQEYQRAEAENAELFAGTL